MPVELAPRLWAMGADRGTVASDGQHDGSWSLGQPLIEDHPHDPAGGWSWSRCVVCGLGEAAHAESTHAGGD